MKVAFVIQGEGRGHLTQAIAMKELLQKAGHTVVAALVGQSEGRIVPDFFRETINAPVFDFVSPTLIYRRGRIDLRTTIIGQIGKGIAYAGSVRRIHHLLRQVSPDLIINFYDPIAGIYNWIYGSKIPFVTVGHQYLMFHSDFPFPKASRLDKYLVILNTRITSLNANRRLALSFRPMNHFSSSTNQVVSPLLRESVKKLQPETEPFFLAYVTHPEIAQGIIRWHQSHSHYVVHCFWNNPDYPEVYSLSENLTFHQVNAQKYTDMMRRCSGLATTAGFESVCEAMYLGKPVLMVPVPNHFEQMGNALDGELAGAGIRSDAFDLTRLIDYSPVHSSTAPEFQKWVRDGETRILNILEETVTGNKRNSTQASFSKMQD